MRQQQIAAAQAEAEAAEPASSPAVAGSKRSAEDEGEAEGDAEDAAGRAKRVRWEDEQVDESTTGIQEPSTSALPPGFFDNPSDAAEASQSTNNENDISQQPPEGDEMAEFEAFLAQEEPEASTSTLAGPTTFSAQATISAGEVLFNQGEDENGEANGDEAADDDDDDDEPKETEEERQAREEREELMERIEQ